MSRLSKSHFTPILCYVTDRRILSSEHPADALETLLGKIEQVAAAGADWIQIREKDLSAQDSAMLTGQALERAAKASAGRARPTRVLINDRLDVALAQRAGGVHLAENSLPVADAKRLVDSRSPGKDFLVGVSCHSLGAAKSAESGGADYIFFGPVFPTPSKAAYGAPQGIERLGEVCRAISIPVLAIGGITRENLESCLDVGASGMAAIRLFQDAEDVKSLVRTVQKPRR